MNDLSKRLNGALKDFGLIKEDFSNSKDIYRFIKDKNIMFINIPEDLVDCENEYECIGKSYVYELLEIENGYNSFFHNLKKDLIDYDKISKHIINILNESELRRMKKELKTLNPDKKDITYWYLNNIKDSNIRSSMYKLFKSSLFLDNKKFGKYISGFMEKVYISKEFEMIIFIHK